MMYDVVIVGSGPAGMTAAIYAARKKLKTLMIGSLLGGEMVYSNQIDNYTGFDMVTGVELTDKFNKHLKTIHEDLETINAEVIHLEKLKTGFAVTDKERKQYFAKTIIIASGRNPKKLGIPGEDQFFGKGVAVCSTCDAPLYKGKDVVVVGGGNSAMDALIALSKSCNTIYSVNINKELMGDEVMKTKISATPNIQFLPESTLLEIIGDKTVTAVKVKKANDTIEKLAVQGVFVEIGWVPSVSFDILTTKNEQNEIKVDKDLQTSVPGIFAAGDVNDAWGEQIIIAAGEGAKAAMAAAKYINRLR